MLKPMMILMGAIAVIFAITLGFMKGLPESDDRDAEACEYEINLIGSTARGFRYLEPERGHCWDCRSDEGTMSDSAMRVCGRKRSKKAETEED